MQLHVHVYCMEDFPYAILQNRTCFILVRKNSILIFGFGIVVCRGIQSQNLIWKSNPAMMLVTVKYVSHSYYYDVLINQM